MKKELSFNQARLVTGISILLMGVLAGYCMGGVFTPLIAEGNPTLTTNNIVANQGLFISGIISWLLILVCDLLTSYGVIILFKQVNATLAKLSGWLRIVYSIILGVAIYNLILAYMQVSEASNYLDNFFNTWSLGLIIFGLHLVVLAYLFFNKQLWQIIISAMLMVAGIGYFAIHLGDNIIVDFEQTKALLEQIFMAPMILGEIGFAIYLLAKSRPLMTTSR